jgi:hypothetical protein
MTEMVMPFRNSVTVIASPRSRVGKTLLARLLVDFHAQEGRAVAGFDLNSGGGTLAQFLPEVTAVSAIGGIAGQMALFDRLVAEDGAPKVVDLGHESFAGFFALAEQIGFAEEAVRRAIAPAVLFVMTPDTASAEAYEDLHRRFPQMQLTPVHNEIFGGIQHRDKYAPTGQGVGVLRLPALAPGLRKYVETPPFSFSETAAAAGAGLPREVESELQRWVHRVFREFREMDLRLLLADLQSSIRLDS